MEPYFDKHTQLIAIWNLLLTCFYESYLKSHDILVMSDKSVYFLH